jgi:chromosomal replication initiator protein
MSPRKLGHIVRARQAAIYLTDSLIKNWTLMRIGMYFQRDHTTVIHAINSVRDLRESNEELDKKLSRIEAELRPVETAA